ncbi:MAG: proline dehydrogenase, partial [Bacteroidetes bacterium]
MSDNLIQNKIKINFENTEIAFKSKSNAQLNKAYLLFKVMGNPGLVKVGNSLTKIAIGIHFPIGWAARPTLYAHFVGGETIKKCNTAVKALGEYNVKAILDYSVEGKDDDVDIEKALTETIDSIKNAGQNPN